MFFRLRSLRAGDRVEVSLADGVVARFVVRTVAMYPKKLFPARLVYASHGYSALQLVTCGGNLTPIPKAICPTSSPTPLFLQSLGDCTGPGGTRPPELTG